MDILASFLTNLSYRFRSENDLSDITWTMCQTSDKFQCAFLQFFFPWLNENCGAVSIVREESNDNSRPDFAFEFNGEKFLIENKIGDRNHHFEQYLKTYKIDARHLGYIANYPINKKGFETHTWKELYLYLQNRIPEEEKQLWQPFLEYVKDVCYIFLPSMPINLNGMYSLYTFYRSLDDVFVFDVEEFHTELYDSKKDTNGGGNFLCTPRDGVMGKYFEVKFQKASINKAWGWMGVYFEREEPLICIGFCNRKDWGRPVYNILDQVCEEIPEGTYASSPYYEDDAYWFDFKQNQKFNQLELTAQIQMLRDFFKEVLMSIHKAKTPC